MAEAKRRDAWDRTSLVACILANANRDPKKRRPFTLEDFTPFKAEKKESGGSGISVKKAGIGILKIFAKK